MRWLFFSIIFIILAGLFPARAQNVVQEYRGKGSTTTGFFTVKNGWEVRWNALRVVSVAVMASDGTIVAGGAGVLRGSLFVPMGGQYYLKITDGDVPAPEHAPQDQPVITNGTNSAPFAPTAPLTTAPAIAAPPEMSWHLQVIELGATADQALTVFTPYFVPPYSAVAPTPPPPPIPKLTNEQTQALVLITGDKATGNGFLFKTAENCFVVTNLHLLANNPNIKITTTSGAAVTVLSLKGAVDRDLAMFTIQDNHYSYLAVPKNIANTAQLGDADIIPLPGSGGEVMLGPPGKLVGIGSRRIDFDNDLDRESIGSPVIHAKSGTVLAVVTPEIKVNLSPGLLAAWPGNPTPGTNDLIPYFGLRFDNVPAWETYNLAQFESETSFLQQFHDTTRALDSYVNGRLRDHDPAMGVRVEPDTRFFMKNAKIRGAHENFRQLANDADMSQQLDASRELLSSLETLADTDMATLTSMSSPYSYDQNRIREELAYRTVIKKQLADFESNIIELNNIARSR